MVYSDSNFLVVSINVFLVTHYRRFMIQRRFEPEIHLDEGLEMAKREESINLQSPKLL